jgi:hypothetical protein
MNVLGLPIPDGYELPFVFTLIIMLVKFSLILFITYKLARKRNKENAVASTFLKSVLFLMICFLVSRFIYMLFDFFLTKFDSTTYPLFPNIWYWKTATLISAVGIGVLLLIIDRRILQNKFKGLFGIIIFIASAIQFFYPVQTEADFNLVSTIGSFASFCSFLIPILFFWIGAKTPGLRKTSFAIAFGVIIYAVGGAAVSATFISLIGFTQDTMYVVSTVMKTIGLVMITYGATHFAA